jgi:hypothetical protein
MVVGKVLVVASASVELTDRSVVGTGVGIVAIRLPGSKGIKSDTPVGFGPSGLEMICIPAKAS